MTTGEFVSVAEEVSDREVASFIGQWLERAGLPKVRPTVEAKKARGGGWDLSVGVEQTR